MDGATTPMPKYRCHKEVWALKIAALEWRDGGVFLVPEEQGYAPIRLLPAYMQKHDPQVGGYYVVYKDGYQSFSPADAFEEGYAPV